MGMTMREAKEEVENSVYTQARLSVTARMLCLVALQYYIEQLGDQYLKFDADLFEESLKERGYND